MNALAIWLRKRLSAGGKELNHEHYEFDSNQQHRNHRGARCSRTGRAPGRDDHPEGLLLAAPTTTRSSSCGMLVLRRKPGIKKISLDIARNEVIAFIGLSGAASPPSCAA